MLRALARSFRVLAAMSGVTPGVAVRGGEAGPRGSQRRNSGTYILTATVLIVLGLLVFAPHLLGRLLPGCIVAMVGFSIYSFRAGGSKFGHVAVVLLLATYALPWVINKRSPTQPAEDVRLKESERAPSPHSGEELMQDGGGFVRLADPTNQESPLTKEWPQALLGTLTTAIRSGREQVVIVFSREGCPWCEKQLPVVHRAMQRRAGGSLTSEGAVGDNPSAAFAFAGSRSSLSSPGMHVSLKDAPLRVFVMDASEFPFMIQQFGVQAFPTTFVFGSPGVPPVAAQGYLDDENFEKVLDSVAKAKPQQSSRGPNRQRRGLFR